ncbi:MAG: bifunctional precorrin-2 dehydrogenase/sirohydrochlorin ferrochelatase [Halolamina sp.]
MIPLVHDFADETVLIFGGGPVGARKARRFAVEAETVVVAPTFEGGPATVDDGDSDATDDPGEIADAGENDGTDADAKAKGRRDAFGDARLVRAAPSPADVSAWVDRFEPALVVAATDDAAVNDAAETAAREAAALVNRADRSGERDAGSVVVPATVDETPVRVAVTTGGAAPALSKHLRQRIEAEIEGAGELAELAAELRAELKADDVSPSQRRDAIRAVVRAPSVWKALQGGDDNPRQEAADVIRQQRGDSS